MIGPTNDAIPVDQLIAEVARNLVADHHPQTSAPVAAAPAAPLEQVFRDIATARDDDVVKTSSPIPAPPNLAAVRLPRGTDPELRRLSNVLLRRARGEQDFVQKALHLVRDKHRRMHSRLRTSMREHKASLAALQQTRRKWNARADAEASRRNRGQLSSAQRVEEDWQELMDGSGLRLEAGLQDAFQQNASLRLHWARANGADPRESVVARARDSTNARESIQTLHGRLRDTVSCVVDAQLRAAEDKYHAELSRISEEESNAARQALNRLVAARDSADMAFRAEQDAILTDLRRRGVPTGNVVSHYAEHLRALETGARTYLSSQGFARS